MSSPVRAQYPQRMPQQQQQQRSPQGQYAFKHPNARQEAPRQPQAAYRPMPSQQREQRPYPPNIQVSRPVSPPKAAFNSHSEKSMLSPGRLSPASPQAPGRKGNAASEDDDRYGSVVGSQNGQQMDFWQVRFEGSAAVVSSLIDYKAVLYGIA